MTSPICFSLSWTDELMAHLVLNRPEALITMHPTIWRELDDILTQLRREGTARALVISSTGKHFSAGMALETFTGFQMDDQSPEGRAAVFDTLSDMQTTFSKVESLRIPVICAIQGSCVGAEVDRVTAACIR
jgi:enoyl-CoA hydratase